MIVFNFNAKIQHQHRLFESSAWSNLLSFQEYLFVCFIYVHADVLCDIFYKQISTPLYQTGTMFEKGNQSTKVSAPG